MSSPAEKALVSLLGQRLDAKVAVDELISSDVAYTVWKRLQSYACTKDVKMMARHHPATQEEIWNMLPKKEKTTAGLEGRKGNVQTLSHIPDPKKLYFCTFALLKNNLCLLKIETQAL